MKRIKSNDKNGSPQKSPRGDAGRKEIRVYEEAYRLMRLQGSRTRHSHLSSHTPRCPSSRSRMSISSPSISTHTRRETEKDMKKLLRKFQKIREYARKVDEENMRLRRLVEELQRENGRLKTGGGGAAAA